MDFQISGAYSDRLDCSEAWVPNITRQRPRVDRRAAHRRVTQQEAEGSREPDRILHEGRGQGQPANPGFSSLH